MDAGIHTHTDIFHLYIVDIVIPLPRFGIFYILHLLWKIRGLILRSRTVRSRTCTSTHRYSREAEKYIFYNKNQGAFGIIMKMLHNQFLRENGGFIAKNTDILGSAYRYRVLLLKFESHQLEYIFKELPCLKKPQLTSDCPFSMARRRAGKRSEMRRRIVE